MSNNTALYKAVGSVLKSEKEELCVAIGSILKELKSEVEGEIAAVNEQVVAVKGESLEQGDTTLDLIADLTTIVASSKKSTSKKIKELSKDSVALGDLVMDNQMRSIEQSDGFSINLESIRSELLEIDKSLIGLHTETEEQQLNTNQLLRDSVYELSNEISTEVTNLETMINGLAESGYTSNKTIEALSEKHIALSLVIEDLGDAAFVQIAKLQRSFQLSVDEKIKNFITADEVDEKVKTVELNVNLVAEALSETIQTQAEELSVIADQWNNQSGVSKQQKECLNELTESTLLIEKTIDEHSTAINNVGDKADLLAENLSENVEAQSSTNVAFSENISIHTEALLELSESVIDVEKSVKGINAEAESNLNSAKDDIKATLDGRVEDIAESLTEEVTEQVTELSKNLKGDKGDTGKLKRANEWVPEFVWRELDVVRHDGGLWQAKYENQSEPAHDCEDWILLASGVQRVSTRHCGDTTKLELIIRTSDGEDRVQVIDFPVPKFEDTYDRTRRYKFYDSIIEGGHRWLAKCNNPKGLPSKSEDWALFGQRGKQGVRGHRGEMGLTGPMAPINKVLEALREFENLSTAKGDGVPMRRWRSRWVYGEAYDVGDTINFDSGLWLAVASDENAEIPPSGIGNNTWAQMLDANFGFSTVRLPDDNVIVDPPINGHDNQADLNIDFDTQIALRETAATGIVSGGLVIVNVGSPTDTIDVAAGTGEIVDGYTDRRNPIKTDIEWLAKTIDVTTELSGNGKFSVFVVPNLVDLADSTISFQQDVLADEQRRDYVQLATVFYRNGVVESVTPHGVISNEVGNTLYDFISFFPIESRTSGLELLPVTLAPSVFMKSGAVFGIGANTEAANLKSINTLALAAIGTDVIAATFDVVTQDGTVITADATVIPDSYEDVADNNTVKALQGTDATVHHMYRTFNDKLVLQLGQTMYANGKAARDNVSSDLMNQIALAQSASMLFSAQIYWQTNASDFVDLDEAGIINNLGDSRSNTGGSNEVTKFTSLSDVDEADFIGHAGQMVAVNDINGVDGDALEFLDKPVTWRNLWAVGTYQSQDMVRDGNWTMVANKTTSERAAPQTVGSPYAIQETEPLGPPVFALNNFANSDKANFIQRYTSINTNLIQSIDYFLPAGLVGFDVQITIVSDPLGVSPQVDILVPKFTVPASAADTFVTKDIGSFVAAGSTFDIVFGVVPTAGDVTFQGDWDYNRDNGNDPAAGEIFHNGGGNSDRMYINEVDNGGTNHGTGGNGNLDNIVAGSTIDMLGDQFYTVDSITLAGGIYEVLVTPASQSGNALTTFTFTYHGAQQIDYYIDPTYYTATTGVLSLATTADYDPSLVIGTDAQMFDLNIQDFAFSPDWDLVSTQQASSDTKEATVEPTDPKSLVTAWVRFDASTNTILDSFNISGVAGGTGTKTLTFATPLADTNYCVQVSSNGNGFSGDLESSKLMATNTTDVVVHFQISTGDIDPTICCVTIFGG